MKRITARIASVTAGVAALLVGIAARADAVDVANAVRGHGCPGGSAVAQPLRRNRDLDELARALGSGAPFAQVVAQGSYRADASAYLHYTGPYSADRFATALARGFCAALTDRSFRDAGAFGSADGVWILVARPEAAAAPEPPAAAPRRSPAQRLPTASPPRSAVPAAPANSARPPAPEPAVAAREIVERVNEARAQGQRCGSERYAPVAPLQLAPPLARIAAEHSEDMATHHEFDHSGHDGSSPSDRVHRRGYPARLIGENIAYGSMTAAEAVEGWLASPGHCANIMDPRFTETGVAIAVASDHRGGPALYFTQLFVER